MNLPKLFKLFEKTSFMENFNFEWGGCCYLGETDILQDGDYPAAEADCIFISELLKEFAEDFQITQINAEDKCGACPHVDHCAVHPLECDFE